MRNETLCGGQGPHDWIVLSLIWRRRLNTDFLCRRCGETKVRQFAK